jgi:hypothetical protein
MSDYKTYEAAPDWTAAEWKDGEPDKHDTLVMLRDTIAKGS